jgi:hypothetical protein
MLLAMTQRASQIDSQMRRCAIVINDGQPGCDYPVEVVNGYATCDIR